jgi:hypothetical protein
MTRAVALMKLPETPVNTYLKRPVLFLLTDAATPELSPDFSNYLDLAQTILLKAAALDRRKEPRFLSVEPALKLQEISPWPKIW